MLQEGRGGRVLRNCSAESKEVKLNQTCQLEEIDFLVYIK